MDQIDHLMNEVLELRRRQNEQHNEIITLREAVKNLLTVQKSTSDDLSHLTDDVKEILKQSLTYELLEKEIALINKRLDKIESGKEWLIKLVGGALITAIVGLLFNLDSILNK